MLEKTKKLTKTQRAAALAAGVLEAPKTDTAPVERIVITPPKIGHGSVKIIGVSPYVSNKFSSFNRLAMIAKQEAGSQANKGRKRDPKDFDRVFKSALHVTDDKWYGIPAAAFRNGMISACRLVGYKMTIAKMSLFCEHDGLDADDGTPLVKIVGPAPVRRDVPVRLADGSTDILARPFFLKWEVDLRLKWDADQFSASDVINLLARVGEQVGVGAGRHDSRSSCGMGWGSFIVRP